MIVYLAHDNEEMQAVSVHYSDFGSAWRPRDPDFLTSQEFGKLLKKHEIHMVTWREIKALAY